jgi:hypothetical protein
MKSLFLAAALVLAAAAPAAAQTRPFDPRAYQGRHVGEPTQILVLASPHLSGTPETFDPAVLEPLLERLAAFRPTAIAIEALPGRHIAQMWEYRESYPEVATGYGGRAMVLSALARNGVNTDMAGAEAEVRRTCRDCWPSNSRLMKRRRGATRTISLRHAWPCGWGSSASIRWMTRATTLRRISWPTWKRFRASRGLRQCWRRRRSRRCARPGSI